MLSTPAALSSPAALSAGRARGGRKVAGVRHHSRVERASGRLDIPQKHPYLGIQPFDLDPYGIRQWAVEGSRRRPQQPMVPTGALIEEGGIAGFTKRGDQRPVEAARNVDAGRRVQRGLLQFEPKPARIMISTVRLVEQPQPEPGIVHAPCGASQPIPALGEAELQTRHQPLHTPMEARRQRPRHEQVPSHHCSGSDVAAIAAASSSEPTSAVGRVPDVFTRWARTNHWYNSSFPVWAVRRSAVTGSC